MRALYQAVREAAVVPNSSRVATLALPLKSLPRALPGASAGGGGGVVRRRLKWARAWEMRSWSAMRVASAPWIA